MDDADHADKLIENVVRLGIAASEREVNAMKQFYTSCTWCGDPTENGDKHCCPDCKKDEDRYERTLRKTGVRRL